MSYRIDPTPNPNSRKITVEATLSPRPQTYAGPDAADPLAKKLLAIAGVKSVFLMNNFCTVTKDGASAWDAIEPSLRKVFDELA